jgi:hypothetical protein
MAQQQPTPGSIWQHRKHDPENGKWHEYEVICVALDGECLDMSSCAYFTTIHTETQRWHDVCPTQLGDDWMYYLWPAVDEPHVIYKSTRDDSGKCWARPLSMFMDGRFTEVS